MKVLRYNQESYLIKHSSYNELNIEPTSKINVLVFEHYDKDFYKDLIQDGIIDVIHICIDYCFCLDPEYCLEIIPIRKSIQNHFDEGGSHVEVNFFSKEGVLSEYSGDDIKEFLMGKIDKVEKDG